MELLKKLLICFLAGAGAGIGTGFAGMSAAAVISPMLITFLGYPAYTAVGVGLASDVLASAVSAYTYKKNKHIDIKNGIIMMVFVLLFTLVGSYAASHVPNNTMGSFSVVVTMILGIRFIIKPVLTTKEVMESIPPKKRLRNSIIGGTLIGLICGFFGAGGGMMMLIVLTSFLGYELKTAVGTSVFVMTFTALTGALSHFVIEDYPDLLTLVFCVAFTLIWARIAAIIANKVKIKTLNRVTGVILILLGIVVLGIKYL